MSKFLKNICSAILSAALLTSAVPSVPVSAATAEASSEENSSTEGLSMNPVVVSYSPQTTKGKELTSISENSVFKLKLTIKDLKVKTSQLANGAGDIDFIKTPDTFKGTVESVTITSAADDLLRYEVMLTDCRWLGGSTAFGFMVGYTGGSDYVDGSVTVNECKEKEAATEDPVVNVAEPTIKITAVEPDNPIKAGDTGEFKIKLKNLGSTAAYNILAEITPSDDILIVDGTGTQDIESLDYKEEKTITIKYKALDKITSLKQSFGVSLRYYYDNGTSEATGSASSQVSVAAEISTTEKVYPVVETSFSLAETELEANKEYSGVLTLKNSGTADMDGLFITFSGSDDIVVTDGTGSRYFENIAVGVTKQLTVKFRTMKEITALKQELKVSLKYNYTVGSEEQEGTYEQSFVMFGKTEEETAPLPVITATALSNPLEAGKQYRKAFYVENKGTGDMKNVTVKVKGSEGISISNGREQFTVDSIKAGSKKRFLVYFSTNADITSVAQTLDIEVEYYYEKAGVLTAETKTGTVTMTSAVSTAPVLKLSGENLGKALLADTEYDYTITVKNYGDITVRDVFIDLTATDALYFLDGTESAYIDIIRPGDTADIKVRFKTVEEITAVKQGINADIKYSYGRNTSIVQKESTASLTLIATANKETTESTAAAPNIIIGKYDIGADEIAAGDTFTLALDFYNTNASTGIENLIMTVNASGDISIYGGSNSFYYASLPAAGEASESVQLRALPTATTGTAAVTVSFRYDYVTGDTRTTATSEQQIFIPLYQPDKMTFSVSKPSYDVYTYNEVYLTLSYQNKGRADASNVKVEVVGSSSDASEGEVTDSYSDVISTGEAVTSGMAEGAIVSTAEGAIGSTADYSGDVYYGDSGDVSYDDPGFTALTTEKVIGTIAAGSSGSQDFVVTPSRAGDLTVVFRITYEDSNMNEIVKEVPVTFTVMEEVYVDPGEYVYTNEVVEEESGGFPWWAWLIIGGVAVIVVVIIIIVNVKKKKGGRKKYTADDIDWEDDLDDNSDTSDSDKMTKV